MNVEKDKLIQAAKEVMQTASTATDEYEIIQQVVQHFTDSQGNKLTLKVIVQPFDERNQNIEN